MSNIFIALWLFCCLGLCAGFPSYMRNLPTKSVVEAVQDIENDVHGFEGNRYSDLEREAMGDAAKFYKNWHPGQDTQGWKGGRPLNALIPCPIMAGIYNNFAPGSPGYDAEKDFKFELMSDKRPLSADEINACKIQGSPACDKLFSSYIKKDQIIDNVMMKIGGAGQKSADGIYANVPHCDEGAGGNKDDPEPCSFQGSKYDEDGIPIFKLHSYTKAIHGSSTQIRYNRESMRAGYRSDQFQNIWHDADLNRDGAISKDEFAHAVEDVFVKNSWEDSSIFQMHAQAVFMSIAISYTDTDSQTIEIQNKIQTDLKSMYKGMYVPNNGISFKAWGRDGVVLNAAVSEFKTFPSKVSNFFSAIAKKIKSLFW